MSNLWWWDNQPFPTSELLHYEIVRRGQNNQIEGAANKLFIYKTMLEKVDYDGDGIFEGTYIVDVTIIWDTKKFDPAYPVFFKAFFQLHSGTGIFEGMKIHEVISEVLYFPSLADVPPEFDPYPLPAGYESYEGRIIIRRHVGQVFNAPEPPVTT
jgi:hypothetical protein